MTTSMAGAGQGPLTRERVLAAAEDALRRYGPAKATVVDVARALEVSHGSVYRHFPSKAALRDAVTAEWLARESAPLERIVAGQGPVPERLYRYLRTLIEAKRRLADDDPELFATYRTLVADGGEAIAGHVRELCGHLEVMVVDGVARRELVSSDPAATARAVYDATASFHDPAHIAAGSDPDLGARFDAVWVLLLTGICPR